MSRKIQFICLFVLLGLLSLATQPGFAQSPPNFGFANNFFVTGDYIVAGAYGMTTNFKTTNGVSYAVGTITVPDTNPGITGTKQVPAGAQIVAALLYWQTVEKVGVKPGAPGSGQNGYFRPMFSGGPAAGYAISGTQLSASSNVSWSSGGCTGGSTGKLLRTYRADVAGGLPVDTSNTGNSGNSLANGSFQVLLPSTGNSTPLTLGATLVVIYRVLSGAGGPSVPLNSIVIYDGDYAQGNTQLTMTQQLQGFYDADQNPVSRLTHIVGNGKSNKFQTVSLSSGTNPFVALPFLYGKQLPAFPGWYGTWDNPTWTFSNASTTSPGVLAGDSYATTEVVPSMSNQGCVSWGAVILSTTVKNSDNDGILDSWKNNHGYCDYLTNPSCSGSQDGGWIPLPGAAKGQKDIFLQYDYMCSKVNGPPQDPNGDNAADNSCVVGDNTNYSFDPRLAVDPLDSKNAAQKVVETFNNHKGGAEPFVLHAVPGNAISESQAYDINGNIVPATCNDTDLTCPFPNEPGTIGFREGLAYIKNQTIEPQTGLIGCDPSTNVKCVAVFPHGKKDSYHYALFSHGVGLPNWFLSDGSISSVSQSGNTVTFTTSSAHGLSPITGDSLCSAANGYIGRVTIVFAVTNQNLNGTYCATPVGNPPSAKKFAIVVGGSATTANYNVKTDPNLAVANGQVTSMSGYSDVGGQNSVISLGYGGWGPPNNPASEGNKWNIKAGTFMHELGHTLALTHGGTFYNNLPNNPPDYTPNFEVNCKPNVQSVMSYAFQFDLLQAPGPANQAPVKVLDYSEDPQSPGLVNTLTENSPQPMGYLTGLSYPYTSWFQLTNFSGAGSATSHCDGTPVGPNEKSYSYTNQPVGDFFWGVDPITNKLTGNDINFNGNANDSPMHPHNEWEGTPGSPDGLLGPSPGVDLRQVSAVGTISTIGPGGEAGGLKPAGGGGGLKPAGGGGGLQPAGGGGGLKPAGGGGGLKPAGGGGLSAEITHNQANSYPRPPQNLFIQQEEASPRLIDLNWFAASFGTAVQYNIYRSAAGGPFANIASVPGSQTMYTDTVTCNTGGYHYRVTAVTNNDAGQPQESSPSNTVPASNDPLLTGCYTVGNFSVPASAVQGSSLQVSWTLTDDFYVTPPTPWASAISTNPVTRLAANTLVAIGPFPGNCTSSGRTTLVADGTPTNAGTVDNGSVDTLTSNANNFMFTWNRTDAFCAGSYTFELDLDHVNGAPAQRQTAATALQLGIDINDQDTPRITTLSLPDATVGVGPYNQTLKEDGGVGAVTWSISQGLLPNGITISNGANNTGVLSGYATTAGTYHFTAQAKDSKGNIGTQAFTLIVHIFVSDTQPSPLPPFTINTTPPDATVGILYTNQVYQSGAVGAVTWSVSSGSLPNGITLNTSTGVLSGYATTAGAYQFTALATDSQGNTGTQTFTSKVHMFVSDAPPPNNPPFTAVTVLPDATVGIPYSNTVYESGGVTGASPYTWGITAGSAPGLAFAANAVGVTNGTLMGTPTTAGIYAFRAQVTDSAGNTGTQTFTITVHIFVSDAQPFMVNTTLPDGTVGAAYSNTIFEAGGTGPFTWTVTSGTTPPGLVLNSASGTLSGTPTVPPPGGVNFTAQVYNFTVQVTDSAGNAGTQALTLRVITPVSFKATTYKTGLSPNAVITADFNKDGNLDLAITNSGVGDNSVSILLGNGDGTFMAGASLATGNTPYALAAGDFNGDGFVDLVVTNFADNTVSVFLGNGTGSFQAPVTYTVGAGPISVVTGDFNGDGTVDLAVANQNDHSVSILLGNGDGTFQPKTDYPAGTTDVAAVATGDFNGDGKLDLALTNPSSDTVSVLINNGDGTFPAPVAYPTGNPNDHPIAVSAVDLNGDGRLDLAVTNLNAKTVAILLGNGDGTFQSRVTYPTTAGAFIGPSAMTTGDFNGDGKVDLAITDQHDNTVSILLGNGNGTFQSPLEFTAGNVNNVVAGVAVGDFNGDGRLDLAVANQTDSTVSVMLHLPQPPTNLAVTNVASGQVTLGWSASTSPSVTYNVYRSTTQGGPYPPGTQLTSLPAGTLTYTDSAVASATTYYYVVTAVGAGNLESVTSNEVSATTP